MGTIGFNAQSIISSANSAKGHCTELKSACKEITDQLDYLALDNVWSGTIKNQAKPDFDNAKESMENLNKSIESAFQTLENIGNGFNNINY